MTHLLSYVEAGNIRQRFDLTKNWGHADNRDTVNTPIATLICPSSPEDPLRRDGIPENSPWEQAVGTPTDYSPTVWVDKQLADANLVDKTAFSDTGANADQPGIMEYNNIKASFKLVSDGLSNTILFAESAGRPALYRKNVVVTTDLLTARVNGGGWPRPASDILVKGTSEDGRTMTGPCAVNCTNGLDVVERGYPDPYLSTFGTSEPYSFHSGIAIHAFGDGSVRSIREEINIREYARLVTRAGEEQTPTNL
jgi:hypothetical protein